MTKSKGIYIKESYNTLCISEQRIFISNLNADVRFETDIDLQYYPFIAVRGKQMTRNERKSISGSRVRANNSASFVFGNMSG